MCVPGWAFSAHGDPGFEDELSAFRPVVRSLFEF
jgi:hypothetical protein